MALLAFCLSVSAAASAAENAAATESTTQSPGRERAFVDLGWFRPHINTTVRLNSTIGQIGTEISLEDDLGLRDTLDQVFFKAGIYATQRLRLAFEYVELGRTKTTTLKFYGPLAELGSSF